MAQVRAHLLISGRVQGVAYRYSFRREAKDLGLTGWVRNLDNGSVEAIIEGEEGEVDQMVEWCRQGPPGARVTSMEVQRGIARGEFAWFEITY